MNLRKCQTNSDHPLNHGTQELSHIPSPSAAVVDSADCDHRSGPGILELSTQEIGECMDTEPINTSSMNCNIHNDAFIKLSQNNTWNNACINEVLKARNDGLKLEEVSSAVLQKHWFWSVKFYVEPVYGI